MPESTLPKALPTTLAPGRWVAGALVLLGGIALGDLAGIGIAFLAAWPAFLPAAGLAASVWLAGAALGLALMHLLTRIQPDNLGFGILASSMIRMLSALGLGLVAFFAIAPEGPTFWVAFLLAGLGALIAETAWAVRVLSPSASRPESVE